MTIIPTKVSEPYYTRCLKVLETANLPVVFLALGPISGYALTVAWSLFLVFCSVGILLLEDVTGTQR